jgi:hypothetical protein
MALKDFDQLSHEIDQAVHTNGPLGKTTAPGLNSVLKSLATEITNLPQAVADEILQAPNNGTSVGLEVVEWRLYVAMSSQITTSRFR